MAFDVDGAREMDWRQEVRGLWMTRTKCHTRESYLVAVSENFLHLWPEGHSSQFSLVWRAGSSRRVLLCGLCDDLTNGLIGQTQWRNRGPNWSRVLKTRISDRRRRGVGELASSTSIPATWRCFKSRTKAFGASKARAAFSSAMLTYFKASKNCTPMRP